MQQQQKVNIYVTQSQYREYCCREIVHKSHHWYGHRFFAGYVARRRLSEP